MRLPNTAHTSRPWRVHEFTADFELEDVWELPTPGDRDDLARLVQLTVSLSDGSEYPRCLPRAVRASLEAGEAVRLGRSGRGSR